MRTIISEKRLRAILTQKLSRQRLREGYDMSIAAEKILRDEGSPISAEAIREKARQLESDLLMVLLGKQDAFEKAHEQTAEIASTAATWMSSFSEFFEDFERPAKVQIDTVDGLRMSAGSHGAGYYFKHTASVEKHTPEEGAALNHSQIAENNYIYFKEIQMSKPAKLTDFNLAAFAAAMSMDNTDEQPRPKTEGELVEIAIAAILANLDHTGIYGALQDSTAGKDIVRDGTDIYFESKYSSVANHEINTNVGASAPTLDNNKKYFIFLSKERGYFVHTPLFAKMSNIAIDALPLSDSQSDNERSNTLLFQFLITNNKLRLKIKEIFSQFYSKTTVFLPTLKNPDRIVVATTSNVQASFNGGHITQSDVNNLFYPTQLKAINEIIDEINSEPDNETRIEMIKAITFIQSATQNLPQAASMSKDGGVQPGTTDPNPSSTQPSRARDLRTAVDTVQGQFTTGWTTTDNSGNVIIDKQKFQDTTGFDSQLYFQPFKRLLDGLIYAWNIKEGGGSVQFQQPIVATSAEGGTSIQRLRQLASDTTGDTLSQFILKQEPAGQAMTLCSLANDSLIFKEDAKKDFFNNLVGTVSYKRGVIQQTVNNSVVKEKMLIELLRSEAGKQNILEIIFNASSQLQNPAFDNINQAASSLIRYRGRINNFIDQKFRKYLTSDEDAARFLSKFFDNVSTNPTERTAIQISFLTIFRTKVRVFIDGITNAGPESMPEENKYWTTFDRQDLWGDESTVTLKSGSYPVLNDMTGIDRFLFAVFFRYTVSSGATVTYNLKNDNQVAEDLISIMTSGGQLISAFQAQFSQSKQALGANFANIFEEFMDDSIVSDMVSGAATDTALEAYKASLRINTQQLREFQNKTMIEQYDEILQKGLITRQQFAEKSDEINQQNIQQPQQVNQLADMLNSIGIAKLRENKKVETNLYNNIIKDIMEAAKKKRKSVKRK